MTRLTAIIIAGNDSAYASSYGPIDGKFGLYISMIDEAPSGFQRPRDLLTSEPIYETSDLAKSAGDAIISKVREGA